MRKALFLCLLPAVFSLKTNAQGIQNNISAYELMTKAVISAHQNDKLKQQYLAYEETLLFDESNYRGEKKPTERSTKTIQGGKTQFAGFNLSIGDLLQTLVSRHEFYFGNPADVVLPNGKQCIVIEFYPKQNLESKTNEDKFINRLRGKLWIDAQNHALWRVEAAIPREEEFSFRIWRTIFFVTVNVKYLTLIFEQIEYGGIMAENLIRIETNFIVLSATKTWLYNYYYENYRLK